jgi:hypothetical protein
VHWVPYSSLLKGSLASLHMYSLTLLKHKIIFFASTNFDISNVTGPQFGKHCPRQTALDQMWFHFFHASTHTASPIWGILTSSFHCQNPSTPNIFVLTKPFQTPCDHRALPFCGPTTPIVSLLILHYIPSPRMTYHLLFHWPMSCISLRLEHVFMIRHLLSNK